MLKEYGLNDKEIEVFLCLVRKKELTAYRISKEIKYHRATTYDILDKLILKGFVSKSEKEGKQYYSVNEISNVLGKVKEKEAILLSMIPEINKLVSKEKTIVKHIDTPKAYNEIDTKIYELIKENKLTYVYIIGNSPELTTNTSLILVEKLIKELSNFKSIKKLDIRGIWNSKFKNDKFMKQFNILGKNRFLENLPSKSTLMIFDNYIAILYFSEYDNVIEIKNKEISEEFKTYFNNLWRIAKK